MKRRNRGVGTTGRYRWSSHRVYAWRSRGPDWLCLDWLGYFGRTRREAKRQYNKQIGACFGEFLRNPFDNLRGGLVLGGEVFWKKVCALVERCDDRDAIRWRRRVGQQQLQDQIEDLVREQEDPGVRVWHRVRLGGQRMSEVVIACRCRDGSGVGGSFIRSRLGRGKIASWPHTWANSNAP